MRGTTENIQMTPDKYGIPPPKYELDRPGTLSHRWWDVRAWSKKKMLLVGGGLVVVIIILAVVIGVEVSKKNAYPNYSQLSYSLKDSCEFELYSFLVRKRLRLDRMLGESILHNVMRYER